MNLKNSDLVFYYGWIHFENGAFKHDHIRIKMRFPAEVSSNITTKQPAIAVFSISPAQCRQKAFNGFSESKSYFQISLS